MATVDIVPATDEHARHIAQHVREPDRQELWAAVMQKPLGVMLHCMRLSDHAMTGLLDGEPVCMWGVMTESLLFGVGCPWMVATDRLDTCFAHFLRRSREHTVRMLDDYAVLENHVDIRNKKAIRWLRWMGFKMQEVVPYGLLQQPFQRFVMMRET